MGQMGFFDLGNRYSGLDAKNEPLLNGVRTRRVNRGRDASRGMRL